MDDDYAGMGAGEIAERVRSGRVSAVAVVGAALESIERLDARIRAFREVWPDTARERASVIDADVASGKHLPSPGSRWR
ncbi:hypothetical protein [Nocardiopsis sp. NRRL B-16309]|uniref:hypothetical protein n=1 Tax=Nocardiopsis sp. NRRL B-16309 TaxID=1519494 RepID=UPI0009E7870B